MEENSLLFIKNNLKKYKFTHPNLYKIYRLYIEKHELQILNKQKNLLICINNLENVNDLTQKELLILYNLLNINIT